MQKYYTYVLYMLISILVVTLYLGDFGPMASMQRSLNDMLCRVTADEGPRPNVAIVRIDGRSLDQFGAWPWNRDLIADLSAAVGTAEPKAMVLNVSLMEDPEQDEKGYTQILAGQLAWMKNVVLPYDVSLATYQNKKTSNPQYLFNNSVTVDNPLGLMPSNASLQVRKIFLPADKILESAPYLGFGYQEPDDDGQLRRQPLLANYDGYYYPSLSLIAAARFLNVEPSQIKVTGDKIAVGPDHELYTGARSEFFLKYSKGQAFDTYSAAEVLGERFDFSHLKGKVVLIGLDDLNADEIFDTPIANGVSSLYIQASTIENIINDNLITVNHNSAGWDLLILFALGGLCAFILPRVALSHRFMILAGMLFLLANLTYLMLSAMHTLTETLFFALEIVIFMTAAPILDSELIAGEAKGIEVKKARIAKTQSRAAEFTEKNAPVREIKQSADDPSELKTAAMSFDGSDGIPDDYQTISIDHPDPAAKTTANSIDDSDQIEVEDSSDENFSDSDPIVISSGRGDTPDQVVDANSGQKLSDSNPSLASRPVDQVDSRGFVMPTKPTDIKHLGRYQVEGVLGKGAMGLVYKGIDPAINRAVALKTIRLDFVNDPEEMADLKERLFQEARAAGKLSHPNIVTIYDVGSEGPLQYIAMEYLEGRTLEEMIAKSVKFNYRIIAQIIVQICSALEYAHNQGIIHRDIKPANIMVLPDYRIKVMDYGIAKIDSHSMTKTGIAMGTPNYISPEQLKGLKPDRRGDIFSLGVVMYEMLLSKRPFSGENITTLIYSILHNEPEKPSSINPQIPMLFDRIVEKTLAKNPADRFQTAAEVANSLEDFVESFASR